MKKRSFVALLLSLLLLVSLTGCSSSVPSSATKGNDTKTEQKTDAEINKEKSQDAVKDQSSEDKKPANVNNAEMKATVLFGQVKSISGSKITIAVAERAQRQGPPPANPGTEQGDRPAQGNPGTEQAEKPAGNEPKAAASPELTGENKTITVADNAKITTGGRDNIKDITITSIKAGDMIEVYFKEGSTEVVEQVRVMQAPE